MPSSHCLNNDTVCLAAAGVCCIVEQYAEDSQSQKTQKSHTCTKMNFHYLLFVRKCNVVPNCQCQSVVFCFLSFFHCGFSCLFVWLSEFKPYPVRHPTASTQVPQQIHPNNRCFRRESSHPLGFCFCNPCCNMCHGLLVWPRSRLSW